VLLTDENASCVDSVRCSLISPVTTDAARIVVSSRESRAKSCHLLII